MPLEELIAQEITGIRPFNELPIDALVWGEAHNHHHLHRRLHALAGHRPGIVVGLEVVPTQERTIVVAPGVAVDADGQAIVLSEPAALTFRERGQNYVIIAYKPMLDEQSGLTVGGGQEYYRLIESREIVVTKDLPSTPYLELARVARTGNDKPVREAANSFDPGPDELNILHRQLAFPHCYADSVIGELGYVPMSDPDPNAWKPNRAGLWNLLRAGNGSSFHLDFCGPYAVARESVVGSRGPTLLYMAGKGGFKPLQDAEVEGLGRFLNTGGMLLGEASGGSAEFAKAFQDLSGRLGARLRPVAKGHPLLSAHHLFPDLPPGGKASGEILVSEDNGVFLSTFDYGGAWQGDLKDKVPDVTAARERIRQAQEFGLNFVALAATRRRVRELSRLR